MSFRSFPALLGRLHCVRRGTAADEVRVGPAELRYQARRRSEAWRKHKHRHRERLTITAWRPADGRELDELLVSRRGDGGELPGVGVDLDYHRRPSGPLRDAVVGNIPVADELPASHT